jgi:hypothetical protein
VKTKLLILVTATLLAVPASTPLTATEPTIERKQPPPSGFVRPTLPDLVVTFFTPEGQPRVVGDHVEQRMALGVRNQGNAPAGIFKVAVECTVVPDPSRRRGGALPSGPFLVPFSGDGPNVEWYAYTSGPLAPGASAYFKRTVVFPPGIRGVSVTLRAIADSCSSDELQPSYCRVNESDETNNGSIPVVVSLP